MGYRVVKTDWRFFENLLTGEKPFKNINSLPDDAELKYIRHSTASLRVGLVFESDEWVAADNFEEVSVEFIDTKNTESIDEEEVKRAKELIERCMVSSTGPPREEIVEANTILERELDKNDRSRENYDD